jgi:hypothetical protein
MVTVTGEAGKEALLGYIRDVSSYVEFEVTGVGTIRTKTRQKDCLVGDCPLLAAAKHVNPETFANFRNLDFTSNKDRVHEVWRNKIQTVFGFEYNWIAEAADKPHHPARRRLMEACRLTVPLTMVNNVHN